MADVKIRVIAEDETKGILDKLDLKMIALTGTAIKLAKEYAKFAFESTKYAARVETLGVVTEQLGENAGITLTEIRELERAIQDQGITTEASRKSLAKMMQAELDLADATDLARLAQDAAVIAGVNSSEAFSRLVDVISTGNVRMARTMGLQVDFNKGYQQMAEEIGKTVEELTAQEKAQSRTNSVMAEGAQIADTYAAAMDSVGKQVTSTPRYWDEFKRAFGEANIDTLGEANNAWQKFLKNRTIAMDFDRLYFDALEQGLMTMDKARQLKIDIALGDMEQAEAIEILLPLFDARDQAIQDANDLQHEGLITKLALTEAEIGLAGAISGTTEETKKSISSMNDWTAAAIGASAQKVIWDAIAEDGIITEEELTQFEAASTALGVDIPEGFRTMVNVFNESGGDVIDTLDEINSYLTGLTGQTWTIDVSVGGNTGGGRNRGAPAGVEVLSGAAGVGHASGADFTVPPGFPNDSYPMRVESGERVQVTPAGQTAKSDTGSSGPEFDYNQFARVLRDTLLQVQD